MYVPPELRELIYDKSDYKTKARMRLANRAVRSRPAPPARGDYLRGTGRYQKIWNELPKKLVNVAMLTKAGIQVDPDLFIVKNGLENLRRMYKTNRTGLPVAVRGMQLVQVLGIDQVPTDATAVVDTILVRADAFFRARRPPQLNAMDTRLLRSDKIAQRQLEAIAQQIGVADMFQGMAREDARQRRLDRRAARRVANRAATAL